MLLAVGFLALDGVLLLLAGLWGRRCGAGHGRRGLPDCWRGWCSSCWRRHRRVVADLADARAGAPRRSACAARPAAEVSSDGGSGLHPPRLRQARSRSRPPGDSGAARAVLARLAPCRRRRPRGSGRNGRICCWFTLRGICCSSRRSAQRAAGCSRWIPCLRGELGRGAGFDRRPACRHRARPRLGRACLRRGAPARASRPGAARDGVLPREQRDGGCEAGPAPGAHSGC